MKKKYQKPGMVVENFMVSDYIASCTDILTFSNNEQCTGNDLSLEMVGIIGNSLALGYFNESGVCVETLSAEELESAFEGKVCYHTPSGTLTLFSS